MFGLPADKSLKPDSAWVGIGSRRLWTHKTTLNPARGEQLTPEPSKAMRFELKISYFPKLRFAVSVQERRTITVLLGLP
jgi:hypothetical protein